MPCLCVLCVYVWGCWDVHAVFVCVCVWGGECASRV